MWKLLVELKNLIMNKGRRKGSGMVDFISIGENIALVEGRSNYENS